MNTLQETLTISQVIEVGETEPKRRTRGVDRHQSIGRLFVIKKLCSESFDDIRGYMFQANKVISSASSVSEIAEVSDKLSQLIEVRIRPASFIVLTNLYPALSSIQTERMKLFEFNK